MKNMRVTAAVVVVSLLLLVAVLMGSSGVAATFSACGLESEENFVTWADLINSNHPVFHPESEEELALLVRRAAEHKCRVRARGAGMSGNGLVAQLLEERVVVVSLDRLQSAQGWEDALNPATGVATIGAGKSLFELMRMARPHGWLFPNPKAGYSNSVGGIVSNTVAGGAVGGGFLYEAVAGLRVMHGDGSVEELAPDTGFAAAVRTFHYPMTSQTPAVVAAWTAQFQQDQAELFATQAFVECFLNPWPDRVTLLNQVTCLTAAPSGEPFPNPADPQGSAQRQKDLATAYTAMAYNPVFQDLGSRGEELFSSSLCSPFLLGPVLCQDPVARAYGGSTVAQSNVQAQFANSQSLAKGGPEDLFWSSVAIPFESIVYFVPQDSFPLALGAYLQTMLPFLALGSASSFLPVGSLEWRLTLPKGTSAFEYLTSGQFYFQVEALQLLFQPSDKYQDVATADVFKLIEDSWRAVGGLPHQGKGYGYGAVDTWFFGQHNSPFVANISLYTPERAAQLSALLDPVFSAGSQIRELVPADYVQYEIRHLDGRGCADFDYLQCVSEECDRDTLLCSPASSLVVSSFLFLISFVSLLFC